jgi:hypothetical protein
VTNPGPGGTRPTIEGDGQGGVAINRDSLTVRAIDFDGTDRLCHIKKISGTNEALKIDWPVTGSPRCILSSESYENVDVRPVTKPAFPLSDVIQVGDSDVILIDSQGRQFGLSY